MVAHFDIPLGWTIHSSQGHQRNAKERGKTDQPKTHIPEEGQGGLPPAPERKKVDLRDGYDGEADGGGHVLGPVCVFLLFRVWKGSVSERNGRRGLCSSFFLGRLVDPNMLDLHVELEPVVHVRRGHQDDDGDQGEEEREDED